MARRSYRRRGSYRGRRYGFSASRRGFRGNFGGMRVNLSTPFLAGVAVGYTDLDAKIPGQLVLGAATAPVQGAGTIKAGAQGIVFGNLLQQVVGGNINKTGFKGV